MKVNKLKTESKFQVYYNFLVFSHRHYNNNQQPLSAPLSVFIPPTLCFPTLVFVCACIRLLISTPRHCDVAESFIPDPNSPKCHFLSVQPLSDYPHSLPGSGCLSNLSQITRTPCLVLGLLTPPDPTRFRCLFTRV